MHPSALLILTTHVSSLCKGDTVTRIVTNVKKLVKSTLYVHLNNTQYSDKEIPSFPRVDGNLRVRNRLMQSDSSSRNAITNSFSSDTLSFVTKFYSEAALQCRHIDVNVLLHNIGTNEIPLTYRHGLPKSIHCVLVDMPDVEDQQSQEVIREFVQGHYDPLQDDSKDDSKSFQTDLPVYGLSGVDNLNAAGTSGEIVSKKEGVVLGGTFDQLHVGHKVLLTEAILLASKKLVIGVSDGPLLQKKILKELIQPFLSRKQILDDFIRCVGRPGLELNIARIEDPYGPSVTDPDLQIIVVSKETEKGGHMVNEERKRRGLSHLDVHIISKGFLLEDEQAELSANPFDETKVSSSSLRYRLLGTLLKPPSSPELDFLSPASNGTELYIIGLTGGIAAGKSSIAKRLEKLGAVVIDCDELGHLSYVPGSNAFGDIVETFGRDILDGDGAIDRRKLGGIVFSNRNHLDRLNSIVWPEIGRLCKEKIEKCMTKIEAGGVPSDGRIIFVLDAAVLLEAGWDRFCNEVWVTSVSQAEAIKRIVERNKITEASVKSRIESQVSNQSRVDQANVVLSTLWEPSVTQSLVEKAWGLLQERLGADRKTDVARRQEMCHKL